jgi:hypothetical protein
MTNDAQEGKRRRRPFVEGFAFALAIGGITSGKYWGEVAWWKIVVIFSILCPVVGALNVLRVRMFAPRGTGNAKLD